MWWFERRPDGVLTFIVGQGWWKGYQDTSLKMSWGLDLKWLYFQSKQV